MAARTKVESEGLRGRVGQRFDMPPGACDCHVHVFDPDRFPYSPQRTYTPGPASVDDLLAFGDRIGVSRYVIVQPSVYGADNACLLAALNSLGDRARGVAVINPDRVRTGGNPTHVPDKGGGPALTDVLGGHVDFFLSGLPGAMPHVSAGTLKALAVSRAKRSSSNADVPTIAESGVADFGLGLWVGFFAPKATPREIVYLLNRDINEMLASLEMQQQLQEQGLEVTQMSVDETATFVSAEIAKYGEIIKVTGVKGE